MGERPLLAQAATDEGPIVPLARRERLEVRLRAWNPAHVLGFWDQLDPLAQRRLAHQIETLDLEGARGALKRPTASDSPIGLPQVERHPAQGGDAEAFRTARALGDEALRAGEVAILLAAGGQGTRLGHRGPKGTFPIGPVTDRSLFEVFAQQLQGIGRRVGLVPPWLIMTSPENDAATRRFFTERDHFGLDPSRIHFFVQSEAPCLGPDGTLQLAAPDRVLTSPDGHGGVVAAMLREGLFDRLAELGIEHLFFHQVDNALLPVGDPQLVGWKLLREAQIASKVVAKRSPEDRVGTWISRDDRVQVIEYTELDEPERSSCDAEGHLRFWAGSINVHVFDRAWLHELARNEPGALPYHASPKPLDALASDGTRHPVPGFKLERFIFDVHAHAPCCVLVEAERENEYAPVKNASGGESIARARAALVARDQRWLEQAGVTLVPGAAHELDLSVFDGPDALRSSGARSAADRDDISTAPGAQPGGQS